MTIPMCPICNKYTQELQLLPIQKEELIAAELFGEGPGICGDCMKASLEKFSSKQLAEILVEALLVRDGALNVLAQKDELLSGFRSDLAQAKKDLRDLRYHQRNALEDQVGPDSNRLTMRG